MTKIFHQTGVYAEVNYCCDRHCFRLHLMVPLDSWFLDKVCNSNSGSAFCESELENSYTDTNSSSPPSGVECVSGYR